MYDKTSRPSWRDGVDSGSESQPLLSSDASRGSRRSFGVLGLPFESETSDCDAGRSDKQQQQQQQPLLFANGYQYRNRPLLTVGSNDGHGLAGLAGLAPGSGGLPASGAAGARAPYLYYTQPYGLKETTSPVFVPLLPEVAEPEPSKQGSLVTIFAVWNTIMGTSLLAMPWGLERAGLAGGPLLIVGMGALCLYTAWRVLRAHRLHGSAGLDAEVSELCRRLLGRWAELLARIFSLVVLLGAIVVYWILMSNFLFHSIDYLHDEITGASPVRWENVSMVFTPVKCHQLTATAKSASMADPEALALKAPGPTPEDDSTFRHWWNLNTNVPIYLVLIMAPLMNFKSATFFTKFNSIGTLSVLYLLIFIMVKSSAWGVNVNISDEMSEHYSPLFSANFPATSGMLALSYFIHNIILTIMKNNRHQENNGRDLSIAYVLVTVTYAIIGCVFYISFPLAKSCIEDNLLNNFESWDPMTVAARAFLFFQLVTVFPLVAYMLRSQLCTMILGHSWPGRLPVLGINAVFIIICVLFAIFLPRFGTIIRFTGAISGMVYIFMLPVLLHFGSLQRQGKLSLRSILLHMCIPVIGGANLIAQFFVSD